MNYDKKIIACLLIILITVQTIFRLDRIDGRLLRAKFPNPSANSLRAIEVPFAKNMTIHSMK